MIISDSLHIVGYMTDMNEVPNRLTRDQRKWLFDSLDEWIEGWVKSKDRILTKPQIECLGVIAKKNLIQRQLTKAERQMKSDIHKTVGWMFKDLERMMYMDFMGPYSKFDPAWPGSKTKSRLPFKVETWAEEITAERLCKLVQMMVKMHGDKYAYPLAKAIEDGLRGRQENYDFTVEVQPVKYLRQSFTTPL